jgi:AMP phosphorylase
MKVACAVTLGEQPVGRAIGPALEAREALEALRGRGPADLVEKATRLAGLLFETVKGRNSGTEHARRLLQSGKAEAKMREIIAEQGGDPKVRPSDIPLGRRVNVRAAKEGRVLWIKNAEIAAVAREAGAPRDPGAGVLLHVKTGSRVKRGGLLFSLFSNNGSRIEHALRMASESEPVVVARGLEQKMLLDKIPTRVPHPRPFILER